MIGIGDVVLSRSSRLCFRVAGLLHRAGEKWPALRAPWGTWYDAYWFKPAPPSAVPVVTLEQHFGRHRKT